MNEQTSSTVSDHAEDMADADSDDSPLPSLNETGRELVVTKNQDRPKSWFFNFLTKFGLRSRGSLRDDLNEALSGGSQAGDVFSPEERAMLQNILRLRERRVEDVMVPRAEIHAVDQDINLGELLKVFEETGHSRLPVYNENLDDPRGMILVKDLLLYFVDFSSDKKADNAPAGGLDFSRVDLTTALSELDVMRKIIFVPPSMLAADLMARMQATRTQMALVIDEYGGTDGLVSLEDIVEEVVGEIEDEHDEDDDSDQITKTGDTTWVADSRVELDKVIAEIGPLFNPGEDGEDVETIGGLVFALAGHIPVRGEVVRGMVGFEFRILDADPRRIRRLQIVQNAPRPDRKSVV